MKDLIIDCFAGGGGASVGIEMALGRQVDIAINHDPDAILMHKTNHPDTLHLTEDIFKVDLKKYVAGRKVALMWASPDCTSHSKAKGGKPREKGLRILPWAVYKHAKAILPNVIIMENVEEIQQWGPLSKDGHPIPGKKGEDYKKFIIAMKSLGYMFESRELVAADYGAPTTRKRWYAIFRRDGNEIIWPTQTHKKGGGDGMEAWEPIWKHLNLTDLGKSIFGRKKPLAENTMKRIARGLGKFVFENPEPFIVQVNHGGDSFRGQNIYDAPYMMRNNTGAPGRNIKDPMLTIMTGGHHGLISPVMCPFIDKAYGGNYKGAGSDIKDPINTITSVDHNRMVTPYIMQIGHTGFTKDRNRSVEDAMSTVVTKNEHCLVSPLLIQYHSETTKSGVRGQKATEPIQTIDTSNRYGLVSAFLTKFYKTGNGQELTEPIHTITTSPGHFGQVSVLAMNWEELQKAGVDEETAQKATWVSQFIIEYYGCGTEQKLTEPLHTIVTKDRFAMITLLGNQYVLLDIFLRMLTPEELKSGQGFPKDYIIDRDYKGRKYPVSKQVARIGNSVVPVMAKKLVEANCPYLKVGERMPNMKIDDSKDQLRFA